MFELCIAGKNSIAVNALDFVLNCIGMNKSDVCVVPNSTDNGCDSWQPSLRHFANERSICIRELSEVYDRVRVFISLEYNKIVRTQRFKTKKLYNMHFSLLPAYKGMFTSVWPILNGETQSGVTFHRIDDGIDTGDIIAQKKFEISIEDTARDLYSKYLENSGELFKEVIQDVLNDKVVSFRQGKEGASYYSYKSIDFSDIRFDLQKTSFEIYNQIRAFIFPEYQLPMILDRKIWKVRLFDDKIEPCFMKDIGGKILISGIDGFLIEAFYD